MAWRMAMAIRNCVHDFYKKERASSQPVSVIAVQGAMDSYLGECALDPADSNSPQANAFGEYYNAIDPVLGVPVGVQVIGPIFPSRLLPNPTTQMSILTALEKLEHPGIARPICFARISRPDHGGGAQRDNLCILYEGAGGGTLRNALIDNQRASELTYQVRLRAASVVAETLRYLHDETKAYGTGCHRDITSANIHLTRALKPKLVCAGLPCLLDPLSWQPGPAAALNVTRDVGKQDIIGSPGYMCPYYSNSGEFSEASEVFSFGIVLLELVTGKVQRRHGDLFRMFIDEEQGDISSNLDERAGKWPGEIVKPLAQVIRDCCGAFSKRKKFAEIYTTLQALVDCHCQPSAEEAQLEALREELEVHHLSKIDDGKKARWPSRWRRCGICFDKFDCSDGIQCDNSTGHVPEYTHFLCRGCLVKYTLSCTEDQALQRFSENGGILCPQCNPAFNPRLRVSALAHVLPGPVLDRYFLAERCVDERRLRCKLEAEFGRRLQAQQEQVWSNINEVRAKLVRIKIHERILNLRCPKCDQVRRED